MKRIALIMIAAPLFLSAAELATPFSSVGLKIQFITPANWTVKESKDQSSPSVFILPNDPQASTDEGTGMYFFQEEPWDAPLPAKLSGVMAYFRATRDAAGNSYTVLSEEDISVGGYPAKKITYTANFDSKTLKGLARYVEIFTYGPTRYLYNFQYSSLDRTFDKYWPKAKAVIDSIRFKS